MIATPYFRQYPFDHGELSAIPINVLGLKFGGSYLISKTTEMFQMERFMVIPLGTGQIMPMFPIHMMMMEKVVSFIDQVVLDGSTCEKLLGNPPSHSQRTDPLSPSSARSHPSNMRDAISSLRALSRPGSADSRTGPHDHHGRPYQVFDLHHSDHTGS